MGRLTSEKYIAPQHKSNLRNIRGTFAAEGMTISKSTRSNLDRIAADQLPAGFDRAAGKVRKELLSEIC